MNCCGTCVVVADSVPGMGWSECVDKYRHNVDWCKEFDKAKSYVLKGISAWLPKQVRSGTQMETCIEQRFAFLSASRFHELHPDVPMKPVETLKKSLTKTQSTRNDPTDGMVVKCDAVTRELGLPEIVVRRSGFWSMEEDVCPALQIRDKQNLECFLHTTKTRLASRHPLMRDALGGLLSLKAVKQEVKRWTRKQKHKIDEGLISVDSGDDDHETEGRRFLASDALDLEVGKKKKANKKAKQKAKARKESMSAARKGLLSPAGASVGQLETELGGAGISKPSVAIIGGRAPDDEEEPENAHNGSDDDADVDEKCRMPIEASIRGIVGVGNKATGVQGLARRPGTHARILLKQEA